MIEPNLGRLNEQQIESIIDVLTRCPQLPFLFIRGHRASEIFLRHKKVILSLLRQKGCQGFLAFDRNGNTVEFIPENAIEKFLHENSEDIF